MTTQNHPNYSDSYVFGLEALFEATIKDVLPEAFIQFVEKEFGGMSLEIYSNNEKVYDYTTPISSKRRCIENFFMHMGQRYLTHRIAVKSPKQ